MSNFDVKAQRLKMLRHIYESDIKDGLISIAAFELRPADRFGLSVLQLSQYDGEPHERIAKALCDLRKVRKPAINRNDSLVILTKEDIESVGLTVRHSPTKNLKAHMRIEGFTPENQQVMERRLTALANRKLILDAADYWN